MNDRPPNRIREIRKSLGWSLDELAARIGEDVSAPTISRLEVGRIALTHAWLEKIGAALGVPPTELIRDKSSEVRLVPVIGLVSAGNWMEAIQHPTGYLPIPANAAGDRAFALQPQGDSMSNIVAEHEYIVVDPDQLDLIEGKAYIVKNAEGEATFKRYRSDPPRLEPDSSNPKHKPILLGREPIVTVGRVTYATTQL